MKGGRGKVKEIKGGRRQYKRDKEEEERKEEMKGGRGKNRRD